jgi:hypothetical protein
MKPLARNAIGFTGAAGILYGLWCAYPPCAYVAAGSLALFLVVWSHRMESRKDKPQ